MSGWDALTAVVADVSDVDVEASRPYTDVGTGTSKENITGISDTALAMFTPSPSPWSTAGSMMFLETTQEKLDAYDAAGNDSILIGKSINSVYSYTHTSDQAETYYAIGGVGGPYITVDVNHNDADPLGEFWKCSATGLNKFEIITSDSVKYCFPQIVMAIDVYLSNNPEVNVLVDWYEGALRNFEVASGVDESIAEYMIMDRSRNLMKEKHGGNILDYDYGSGGIRKGIITDGIAMEQMQRYFYGSSEYAFQSIEVPWSSEMISNLRIDIEALMDSDVWVEPGDFTMRLRGNIGELAGSSYDEFRDTTGGGNRKAYLREFQDSVLRAEYAAGQPPRENEYETTYSSLEGNALRNSFGGPSSVGTILNSIYMSDAQYLASTYIENVYTFKTIKMPPLTPKSISPTSLATQDATVRVVGYEESSTPYTSGYYVSAYATVNRYDSPALPVGWFSTEAMGGSALLTSRPDWLTADVMTSIESGAPLTSDDDSEPSGGGSGGSGYGPGGY